MNYHEAAEILREHNRWRRYMPADTLDHGPDEPKMGDPKLIGVAIDVAVELLTRIKLDLHR